MSKKSKSKYYVVWVGQNPGIYTSWADCQAQIKGFPNARYKSFKTIEQAEEAFGQSSQDYIQKKKMSEHKSKPSFQMFLDEIEHNSISVDAACSGNPGIMEYRGVNTISGEEIFRMGPFNGGTNNIGEFLALIHGLAVLAKDGNEVKFLYSDSRTALSWWRNKKVKTTLKKTASNQKVFILLERAIKWMELNKSNVRTDILKWNTDKWGEIPADFGRK